MQLTIQLNDEIVASNPFDFEAFAVGYDAMSSGFGLSRLGDAILQEMFRGTKLTGDILDALKPHERLHLSQQAAQIFFNEVEAMDELKKQKNPIVKIKMD